MVFPRLVPEGQVVNIKYICYDHVKRIELCYSQEELAGELAYSGRACGFSLLQSLGEIRERGRCGYVLGRKIQSGKVT